MPSDHPRQSRVTWDVGEANVDEFRDVKGAMEISLRSRYVRSYDDKPKGGAELPARRHRSRDHDSSRIHSLEDALEITLSRHLFDEDGSKTLRSQLLVDAEEVDL